MSTSTTNPLLFHPYAYSSPIKPRVGLSDSTFANNSSAFIFESSSSNNLHQLAKYLTNNSICKVVNPFVTTTKKPAIAKKQLIKIINESCLPKVTSTPNKSTVATPDLQFIRSSPPVLLQKPNITVNDQFEIDKGYLTPDLLFLSGSYDNDEKYTEEQQEEVYRNLYQRNSSMVSSGNSKRVSRAENMASYELLDNVGEQFEIEPQAELQTIPSPRQIHNGKAGGYTKPANALFSHNTSTRLLSSPVATAVGTSASHTIRPLSPEPFNVVLKVSSRVLRQLASDDEDATVSSLEDASDLSSPDYCYTPTRRTTRNSKGRACYSGLSIPLNGATLVNGKVAARSKTGCWTCRVRHKACPEEKPRCSQCVRLQLDCDYSENRPDYMNNLELQQQKLREIRAITDEAKKSGVFNLRKSKS
ncbi:hypothetical protein Cantr_07162 [Candida viswanathii]|uniref:Zn(2)-C6 fungal-type domain-containing protein n=1 Tax=Candida viswanathii TaxID=5486 RepID=A0A367XZI0_9ASCO|nr:hypothetical protein Cantr_07162 [Candida viswanathii]